MPASTLGNYKLVFDAVYTPVDTQLLKDAAAAGCQVSGHTYTDTHARAPQCA